MRRMDVEVIQSQMGYDEKVIVQPSPCAVCIYMIDIYVGYKAHFLN